MNRGLELGTTGHKKTLPLTPGERATHLAVLGASGRGKSKFLEDMIRQDIVKGAGLCLIDPHGTLCNELVAWCATHRLHERRRIHLIDVSEQDWCFGFNPLRLDGVAEPSVRVDAMVKACAQVWGGEDTARTPLLKKCLRAVFYSLATRELTVLEATELASAADSHGIRRFVTSDIEDRVFSSVWADFNALSVKEFTEQFSSTNNRLMEFLSAAPVRNILGQRERVIDFRQCMDEGHVVLVNLALSDRLSADNARLLGTLIVNDLFVTALGRDQQTAQEHPFYLYIDECASFLNEDIEKALDQTRKFGLHLILCLQRLGQLRRAGESVYNGVMTGAQTKVIFGGLEVEDAKLLAENIFLGEFDLEKPKHSLDKPVAVDEVPEWLVSESVSESQTETSTESESKTRTKTEEDGDDVSSSETTGTSTGRSRSTGYTKGRHQTFKPVRKVLPTCTYSLEELLHMAVDSLVNQAPRSAIVKIPGKQSCRITTVTVKPGFAGSKRIARFKGEVLEASEFASPLPLVEQEISERYQALQHDAKTSLNPPEPDKRSFRQKFRDDDTEE